MRLQLHAPPTRLPAPNFARSLIGNPGGFRRLAGLALLPWLLTTSALAQPAANPMFASSVFSNGFEALATTRPVGGLGTNL